MTIEEQKSSRGSAGKVDVSYSIFQELSSNRMPYFIRIALDFLLTLPKFVPKSNRPHRHHFLYSSHVYVANENATIVHQRNIQYVLFVLFVFFFTFFSRFISSPEAIVVHLLISSSCYRSFEACHYFYDSCEAIHEPPKEKEKEIHKAIFHVEKGRTHLIIRICIKST